jgi:hypothetical protein
METHGQSAVSDGRFLLRISQALPSAVAYAGNLDANRQALQASGEPLGSSTPPSAQNLVFQAYQHGGVVQFLYLPCEIRSTVVS